MSFLEVTFIHIVISTRLVQRRDVMAWEYLLEIRCLVKEYHGSFPKHFSQLFSYIYENTLSWTITKTMGEGKVFKLRQDLNIGCNEEDKSSGIKPDWRDCVSARKARFKLSEDRLTNKSRVVSWWEDFGHAALQLTEYVCISGSQLK